MSHIGSYTTGEVAKLCGITVRTVQYYDTRELLCPSELTEGGRRLYSEDDVRRLQVICFLRDLGLSIPTISRLLKEDDPGRVIDLLLSQREQELTEEIQHKQSQLHRLTALRKGLAETEHFSFESIRDVALNMERRKKLNQHYIRTAIFGGAFELLELAGIILWIVTGRWQLFAACAVLLIPFVALFVRWYCRRIAYICPQCHETFTPGKWEFILARHTLRTRRLTCTCCRHKGFCVETYRTEEKQYG